MAVLSGFTASSIAQTTVVVWGDNFDSDPLGSYGQVGWSYDSYGGSPASNISTDNPQGTNTQNWAITFTSVQGFNDGIQTPWMAPNGLNTSPNLADYSLEFDLAVQGASLNTLGGYVGPAFYIFDNWAEPYWGGDGSCTNISVNAFPNAGAGYQHFSLPLSSFVAEAGSSDFMPIPANGQMAFGVSFYLDSHVTNTTANEEIDIANLQLMTTPAPQPLPNPTLAVQPATPGLRIFAMDAAATYNEEGIGTVDGNQSWINAAHYPVTYSINFKDFNTVPGYTFFTEMAGDNTQAMGRYIFYWAPNGFQWSITAETNGFTCSLDYKINQPSQGVGNYGNTASSTNLTYWTTGSTTGVGTWTMGFYDNLHGYVNSPDGMSNNFTLPTTNSDGSSWISYFENPMVITFGTAPNSPAGYGQFLDLASIAITNILDGNEYDNFTVDASLNTNLWDPSFSNNGTNAVVLVPGAPGTTPSYWAEWPKAVTNGGLNYGLETKAHLTDANWVLTTYWNGTTSVLPPTLMGASNLWTLIPNTCLPTADGGTNENGTDLSSSAFFMLQNPPTAQ